ncbi:MULTISPECIES: hypothetical protein [unclassified Plantibacter]|uniref:hypothetical protein n=1 Tax=unclassified Plantibacter TaxID=2624265 RepID=UPI003D33A2C1
MDGVKRRIAWGWLALAIATSLVVSFLIFGTSTGECLDAAPGSGAISACSSEPMMGYAGSWVLGLVAAVVVVYAVIRTFRRPSAD